MKRLVLTISLITISLITIPFIFGTCKICCAEVPTICKVPEDRIEIYMERIKPHIQMITELLKLHNVDENFIWLALVESGGLTDAESERGAVGLWQLTAATSANNGCPSDNRKDAECSTKAATKYLSALLTKFNGNEWDAIVGYNMGGSNYKRMGKPTSEARNLANIVTCLMREIPLETWDDLD